MTRHAMTEVSAETGFAAVTALPMRLREEVIVARNRNRRLAEVAKGVVDGSEQLA